METDERSVSYEELSSHVSEATFSAISSFGFTKLTDIQEKSILHLLDGKDLRGTAKTGSGKTLAFLVPAIESLYRKKFTPHKGLGVLILSPTRELSKQIYDVAIQLSIHHNYSCGLVTGGKNKREEAEMLEDGVNILVATPGRLLDHLSNTESFKHKHFRCLILDEADKMLNTGFEDAMKQVMKFFSRRKQTMLFSATKTSKTNELVEFALKDDFIDIDVTIGEELITADGLDQSYILCPTDKKLLLLCHLIKKFTDKKVMVFLSCCMTVKYYKDLLDNLCLKTICIHGHQPQSERSQAFEKFKKKKNLTLLCTDVAARGWDIPEVDVVIQYDPPSDASDYIHRVGRTARGDAGGQALLFIREEEMGFIPLLENSRIALKKLEVELLSSDKQNKKIEFLVESDECLKYWAKKAFKQYLQSYAAQRRRDVFDVCDIDQLELLKNFGLSASSLPRIDFDLIIKKESNKKIKEGGI